ncbi:MAG: hypothetical protein HY788_19630 [Deltaproteobacteria bacterium]|nr:hypothetical protein [Deltaproteobacteria bacterium]
MSGCLGWRREGYGIRIRHKLRYSPGPPAKFTILANLTFLLNSMPHPILFTSEPLHLSASLSILQGAPADPVFFVAHYPQDGLIAWKTSVQPAVEEAARPIS